MTGKEVLNLYDSLLRKLTNRRHKGMTEQKIGLKKVDFEFSTFVPMTNYENKISGAMHLKYAPNDKIKFAEDMIQRWGMVAGIPYGEDSTGRQKLRMLEPDELVKRACDTAEKAYEAFKERGWLQEMPDVDTQLDMGRANAEKN